MKEKRKNMDWSSRRFALGVLEMQLMEILWARNESSVHDVVQKLDRPLAYTTVMTTLDRLFKKGLLDRRKSGQAFVYFPLLSPQEWGRGKANGLLAGFLGGPHPAREQLISCLLDAVGQHDITLLGELEEKVRIKRKELLGAEGNDSAPFVAVVVS